MTVLLIDDVGRIQEREIPRLVPRLLILVPSPRVVQRDESPAAPLVARCRRFDLSDEPSWPPIYRLVP